MNKGLLAALAVSLLPCSGQEADRPRGLRNSEFRNDETAAAKAGSAPAPVMIGVTLWRLRQPRTGDQARVLVHEPDAPAAIEMTPERIGANARLRPNDRVRISIESNRAGYLYVASQEQYSDGTKGTPYLIFPSRRILNGNNAVRPRKPVEIPEATNRRPYLTLKKSRPDQAGESLVILVAPKPLPDLLVDGEAVALKHSQVESWIRDWGAGVQVIETGEALGTPWTAAEKSAATGGKPLRAADPSPQRIYRSKGVGRNVLAVSLDLQLAN